MKKVFLACFVVLCTLTSFCQDNEGTSKFNFGFEKIEKSLPVNWYFLKSSEYPVTLDSNTKKEGKYSMCIEYKGKSEDFEALVYEIPASYPGKKITLSGYIKTENVSGGWAGLWMRIDPSIAIDNMQKNGVKGTSDWKKYKITLKLNPEKTRQIVIGGLLVGKGKMWLDDLTLSIDGKDISDLVPIPPSEIKITVGENAKEDSGVVKIKLPDPSVKGNMSVNEALLKRRSVREYKDTCLTLAEVSQLLWAGYGISDSVSWNGYGLHTAPSAGALYPLELYLVAGNVAGLPAGIYKYRTKGHYLIAVKSGDRRSDLCNASYGQEMVKNAPATIVYSAVFSRTTEKYGERGRERYVCMDLGHSGENIYLQATAMDIGTCAIGAFKDNEIVKVMDMPQKEEPLYLMPVGKLIK